MISETSRCKLCGKKMEAKGNIEVMFYFSLLKLDLYSFFTV